MKLEVGQELIRTTKAGVGDTCRVVGFRLKGDMSIFFLATPREGKDDALVELSNGERVDPEGWYFDPANPSAWRLVEKPKPAKARSLDEVFEDVLRLGGEVAIDGRSSCTLAVETLRAELKALVSCEECGEVNDCCTDCSSAHERDSRPDDPYDGEDE